MSKTKEMLRTAILPLLLTGAAMASQPAAAADCEIKIGATGPMSGGAAIFGLSDKAAAEFLATMANNDGGLKMGDRRCKVKVLSYDSQYTAAGGAAAANYFASEGVHVVIGPAGSPETTGFRPVAKRTGIINFSTSYMMGVITPEFPLAFHALQAPVTWGPILIKEVKDRFKFKSVMIMAPNDQGGTDAGAQLHKMYADQGVDATEEYFQRGTTNFAPLATRVMNANPGAIEISGVPPSDAALLIRQLTDAGYTGVLGALGGVGLTPLVQGAGGVENIKAAYWLETMPTDDPRVVKMKQEYEKVMGSPPPNNPNFACETVAAEQVMRAISIAGTADDADKIAEALRNLTPESKYLGKGGWRGKTIYGINQELAFPVGLGTIVNGKNLGVQAVDIPAEM